MAETEVGVSEDMKRSVLESIERRALGMRLSAIEIVNDVSRAPSDCSGGWADYESSGAFSVHFKAASNG